MSESLESWRNALQSQYANSTRICNLGALFREALETGHLLTDVYSQIMDPRTATSGFLDFWADRVGVSRLVSDELGEFQLGDEYLRKLIFMKAKANRSNSSIQALTEAFTEVAGVDIKVVDGPCADSDKATRLGQIMTITVILPPSASREALFLIRYLVWLIKASGVYVVYRMADNAIFGFSNSGLETFNNGVFDYNERNYGGGVRIASDS